MIEDFIAGKDFDAFREDPKTVAAVERKLLVISEAAVRLGERAVAFCPISHGTRFAQLATGCGMRMSGLTSKPCGERSRMICRRSKQLSFVRWRRPRQTHAGRH